LACFDAASFVGAPGATAVLFAAVGAARCALAAPSDGTVMTAPSMTAAAPANFVQPFDNDNMRELLFAERIQPS
jgi:hypothetical protein